MDFVVSREPRLQWSMLRKRSTVQQYGLESKSRRTHYVFSGRNAIYQGLKVLRLRPADTILVPAFHCAAAVEPILRYGARVKFYNIFRDCSPDLEDIDKKLDGTTRAILVIHYFGFPQPIEQLQKFCLDRHLYLIEDCAHVLKSEFDSQPLGSFGDISVFSWRKFLPLYDGGELMINNPQFEDSLGLSKPDFLVALKVNKNTFEKIVDDSSSRFVCNGMLRFLNAPYSIARRVLAKTSTQTAAFSIDSSSLEFNAASANFEMSALSRHVLACADLPSIINKRRSNYTHLLSSMASAPGVDRLHPVLPDNVCPWIFPLVVRNSKDFHICLRLKGIPAVTWGGVIHPSLRLADFPDAAFLYRYLIFLPIHQSLSETDLNTMSEIIQRTIGDPN
jgi:perosamine synthetase